MGLGIWHAGSYRPISKTQCPYPRAQGTAHRLVPTNFFFIAPDTFIWLRVKLTGLYPPIIIARRVLNHSCSIRDLPNDFSGLHPSRCYMSSSFKLPLKTYQPLPLSSCRASFLPVTLLFSRLGTVYT